MKTSSNMQASKQIDAYEAGQARRQMLMLTGAGIAAFGVGAAGAVPATAAAPEKRTDVWDKTFPKSAKVEHRKVTFGNRYGITLAADLYVPVGAKGRLPALVVGGPFGAVKEQSSGLYAQTMCERGFVTLAFDASYTGESSGEPRNVASPDINTEDFSAAVDFIGLQPIRRTDAPREAHSRVQNQYKARTPTLQMPLEISS